MLAGVQADSLSGTRPLLVVCQDILAAPQTLVLGADLERNTLADLDRQDQDRPAFAPPAAPLLAGTPAATAAGQAATADQDPDYALLLRAKDLPWAVPKYTDLLDLAAVVKDAPSDLEAIDKFVSAFGLDFQSMMQQDLAASRPMPLKDRVWHVSKVCLSLAQSTLALNLLHNAALQLKGHTMLAPST